MWISLSSGNIMWIQCAVFSLVAIVWTIALVQDCTVGLYGENCDQTCSQGCLGGCHRPSGLCLSGCKTGYTGAYCKDCTVGLYGENCDQTCSQGCLGGCHRPSGLCLSGCKTGYTGAYCKDCIAGRYGSDCSLTCPNNCNSGQCLRDTRYCTGCKPGYYGNKCENKTTGNDLAVGVGIGVGVMVLVGIIIAVVKVCWYRTRSSRAARRQRPPGYDEAAVSRQDENPYYNEMYTSEDGCNLPTDATSAEMSTSREIPVEITDQTVHYINGDVGHYEDIAEMEFMEGHAGDINIEGKNNVGYVNC